MENALAKLEDLAQLAKDAGLNTVARELIDERIPMLKKGRLNLVVLGEFNHGKSTLINALLGAPVLPVGITPTTSLITRLVYAPVASAKVQYTDEREVELSLKQLAEQVRTENNKIRHIEVRYPSDLLAAQVELIDTPGVNDISQQKVEVTFGIIPRADIVIFALDATQVLKQSELRFIEQRMLTEMGERLIFTLNKTDRLTPDEAQEVERYARERLGAILGHVEIFPISARHATRDGDPGFTRLKNHLERFLKKQRIQILLDSAIGSGLRCGSTLLNNLRIKLRGYELDYQDLESRANTVRNKLQQSQQIITQNLSLIEDTCSHLTEASRQRITEFCETFLLALPREVEKASADDVQRYLPGFIETTFSRFLEREGRSLAKALEALAEEVISITNENLRETLGELQNELGIDPSSLNVEVDSTTYDFSVFAMGAFGVSILFFNALLGGLIALATPVVAFVLKDKLEAQIKKKATESSLEAISKASTHATEELVKVVEDFSNRLKRFIEDAGDRLYRQIDEALQTVLTERADKNFDREKMTNTANNAQLRTEEILTSLRTRRESLWRGVQ